MGLSYYVGNLPSIGWKKEAKKKEMAAKMKSQKGAGALKFAKHKVDVEGQKSYKQEDK